LKPVLAVTLDYSIFLNH